LNARLRALDRGDRYEDPLQEALEAAAFVCEFTGAGTLLSADREPVCSDFDLDVDGDVAAIVRLVIATLEAAGAPKGSRLRVDDEESLSFGVTEGLAIYLNGTDLPDEVYATADVDELVTAVVAGLGPAGGLQSYWQGPRETALYLYGPSVDVMRDLTVAVLERFPLAQRCRVVPLPTALATRD
jgi:hypothetical protein